MSLVNYDDRFDLPPIDYDQSKVPQNIKERADGVREAVFGTQNKEFIAQGIELISLTAREALEAQAYDGNSLADVTLAKDGMSTLDARIRRDVNNLENKKADKAEVAAQLAQTIRLDDANLTLNNFRESDRAIIQGLAEGEINAVLGKENVTNENILNKTIGFEKQNFIDTAPSLNQKNIFDGVYHKKWVDSISSVYQDNPSTSLAILPIEPFTEYEIKTIGTHNRFTVALLYDVENTGTTAKVLHTNNSTEGNESFSFTNTTGYNFLTVGVSSVSETPELFVYEETEKIMMDKVTKEEVSDFFTKSWPNYELEKLMVEPTITTERSVVYPIAKNGIIDIQTVGFHDRFIVALVNYTTGSATVYTLYKGENDDSFSNGDETFSFTNTDFNYLVIGLSSVDKEYKPKVYVAQTRKKHFELLQKNDINNTSQVIPEKKPVTTGIEQVQEIYPIMFGVKTTNERTDDVPRPIGWLYYHPETTDLYYANGKPDNLKFLCKWNREVTWNGTSEPARYRPFITKEGDIIFVWRGDLLGMGTGIPNVRQNPIVYPAGNWDNPVEVEINGTKPTSWLQNCGADFIYSRGEFIFAEYTRPSHENAHVWKVTKPFTSPDNWRIVKSEELSGSNQVGMKHFHTVNYDPFSQSVFLASGDDSSAAKIYRSDDFGETFNVVREGSEKYCRLLNFVFTKDKVYWATDSGKPNLHFFFSVERDEHGIPDFDNITEHYQFPDKTGQQATYVTALIEDKGILFLDRYDAATTTPMEIYFWDFKTSTMNIIGMVGPMNGVASTFGFRAEAINWYQPRGSDEIVMGFGNPPNTTDLLGNNGTSNQNRVNNYSMTVADDKEGHKAVFKAIPFM